MPKKPSRGQKSSTKGPKSARTTTTAPATAPEPKKKSGWGGARPNTGGARPGAGRPPKLVQPILMPPPTLDRDVNAGGLPWNEIVLAARAGVDERRIMDAYRLDEQTMRDQGVLERFRDEVRAGNAFKEVSLRVEIDTRGKQSKRNAGSVNILALEARNVLKWDRQQKSQEKVPDLASAKERLRNTLEKLAEQRTEMEGRTITPAMILHREAFGEWPEDLAVIAAGGAPPVDPLVTPGAGR